MPPALPEVAPITPPTANPTPSSTTFKRPAFLPAHLEGILKLVMPGEVHVIVAPPGAGKSVGLRKLLSAQVDARILTRVLWATQSIRTAESLGAEAVDGFGKHGVEAKIVRGLQDLAAEGKRHEYEPQFDWAAPGSTPVKVISHVRVGQIFGPDTHPANKLSDAQLLVIDEEPSHSLIVQASASQKDGRVTLTALAKTASPVGLALQAVAEEAGRLRTPEPFKNMKKQDTGCHLSGPVFWEAFLRAHPDPIDVPALTEALRDLKVRESAFIAQSFAEDAEAARSNPTDPPMRFGLDWSGKSFARPCWRFNVLLPLSFDLPVLVLDGYADAAHYHALFQGRPVHLHLFDPGRPLEIKCAPMLKVEATREGTGSQVQGRQQIAEEIALRVKEAQQDGRKMLLISSLSLRHENSDWSGFLKTSLEQQGLALGTDVFPGHWHAGRGKNAYKGCDVFAVHQPHLNQRYRKHHLTALYPLYSQAAQRAEATAFLEGAEALQMLHRGRQARHPGPDRPRVLLAQTLEDAITLFKPFPDRVRLSEYTPTLRFKRSSNNPRWIDGMKPLVEELLDLFPRGIPRELLQSLPLHERKTARQEEITRQLSHFALTQPDKALYQAFHDKSEWVYKDVEPAGNSSGRELEEELMARCGLTKMTVKGKEFGRGHGSVVYVPAGEDGCGAMADFEAWRLTGMTPPLPATEPVMPLAEG